VALLVGYSQRMLADYRRYRRYLNDNFSDAERLRFAGLQQLLVLQVLVLGIGVVGTLLNYLFDLSYDAAWYLFALRGVLIYALIIVGVQANYAAATSPLRFEPDGAASAASEVTLAASPPLSAVLEISSALPNGISGVSDALSGASKLSPSASQPPPLATLAPELLP
jgi:hypothetical protein